MDQHHLIPALKETHTALQSVYDARDRIHLIQDGYDCEIPSNSIHYLGKVSAWLREVETMLEQELERRE